MTVEDLAQRAQTLPVQDRKRLIGLLVDSLTEPDSTPPAKQRSILDFEGVAAHLADDEDPQEHVNRLRDEWDRPRED